MAFPNIIRKIVDLIGRVGAAETAITQKAPISHAATATTYGKGTVTLYGHVRLSDATNGSAGVDGGTAATPVAVKEAYTLANTANTRANSATSDAGTAKTMATAAQTTANNAMPKAGGTFTGKVTYKPSAEVVLDVSGTNVPLKTIQRYPLIVKYKNPNGSNVYTRSPFGFIPYSEENGATNSGAGFVVNADGTLVLASGEAATKYVTNAGISGSQEDLHIVSDVAINFVTNLDGSYGNNKKMVFHSTGNLELPVGASITAASFTGKAATAGKADQLATPRALKVNLASTGTAKFNGTADQNAIPVSGVLSVSNGGTGKSNLNGLVQTGDVDQTINGVKTFTAGVRVTNNANSYFNGKEAGWVVGTAPTENARIKGLRHLDKNDAVLGFFYHNMADTNDFSFWDLGIRKNAAKASQCAGSILGYEIRFLARGKSDTSPATFAPWVTHNDYSSNINLGDSNQNRRWANIYTKASSVTTSDKRLKDRIANIPDDVLDAWGDIQWQQYKMKDAIASKGGSARLHNGLIAQDVADVFKRRGLNAAAYGFFCHDYADTQGGPDIYSIRYEEALAMEAAYQRRELQRANQRIKELEQRLANIESVVNV